MGDKSRRARRGKSKRGGRRQKTEEATNEMSDREKLKLMQGVLAKIKILRFYGPESIS